MLAVPLKLVPLIARAVVKLAAEPVVFWLPAVLTPGRLMFAEPLNETPPMVLAVVKVAAEPVVFWLPAVLTPGRLILAVPLKLTPPIVLAFWRAVAVAALPVVEDDVVALPLKAAVMVPAEKLPEPSLATIVFAVLAFVALLVTVNVLPPAWSAVNDADPESPVPETPIVSVPLFGEGTASQEATLPFVVRYSPLLPVCEGSNALIALEAVVSPVPPEAIGRTALFSATIVLPATYTERPEGYVTNTSFVPALKFTTNPPFDESSIVSRLSVVPEAVKVPIPTSKSAAPGTEMV